MIELYHAMHSTCSQKVRLCLAEKALPFQSRLVAIDRKEHLTDWYLQLNPNGVVPTLVHDGATVLDSSVICEYLDEQFPEVPLTPRSAVARARMRSWMRYFEEVPTAAVRVPSFNGAFLTRFEGLDEARFRKEQSDVRPLRKHFYRRMGPKGFSHSDLEASVEQLASAVKRMDAALAHGPWLLGETYSLADIVVAPLIDRMEDLGLDDLWNDGKRPAFAAWFERIRARPAFTEAFPKGARLTEFLHVTSTRTLLASGAP